VRAQLILIHTRSILPSDDIEKSKAWITGCHERPNCWNFVIELLTAPSEPFQPRVIGLIGAVRAPEVGYMLNADYWGKGYATEALRAFMSLFFDHFDGQNAERFEYAEALTDPELLSSQNVLSKVGFKFQELKHKDFENPILGWRDTMVFRMSRTDFKSGGSVDGKD
jgi:RimJ/RimL family protein N-acetyltransferase